MTNREVTRQSFENDIREPASPEEIARFGVIQPFTPMFGNHSRLNRTRNGVSMEDFRTDENVEDLATELKGFHFASRFGTPKVSSGVKAIMEVYCAKMRAMPASEREEYEKPYKEALLWSLRRPQTSQLPEAETDPPEHRSQPRRRSRKSSKNASIAGTAKRRNVDLSQALNSLEQLSLTEDFELRQLEIDDVEKLEVVEEEDHEFRPEEDCAGVTTPLASEGTITFSGGQIVSEEKDSLGFLSSGFSSNQSTLRVNSMSSIRPASAQCDSRCSSASQSVWSMPFGVRESAEVTMEDRELSVTPPPSSQRRTSAGKNSCINKEQVSAPATPKKQRCSKQQSAAAAPNNTKAKRGRKPRNVGATTARGQLSADALTAMNKIQFWLDRNESVRANEDVRYNFRRTTTMQNNGRTTTMQNNGRRGRGRGRPRRGK